MNQKNKIKILFLCTGNSCRSQMAEGWARHLKGDVIEPYSAGVKASALNSYAVKVMAQRGVDISQQKSKSIEDIKTLEFDYVITVCDHAREHCPIFPGIKTVIHKGFDDPPLLAASASSEEESLVHYNRVSDEIKAYVETLPQALVEQQSRHA